jgi:hypothetical protein
MCAKHKIRKDTSESSSDELAEGLGNPSIKEPFPATRPIIEMVNALPRNPAPPYPSPVACDLEQICDDA